MAELKKHDMKCFGNVICQDKLLSAFKLSSANVVENSGSCLLFNVRMMLFTDDRNAPRW